VSFGPFELGDIERGDVKELEPADIRAALGDLAKDIDLDGPVLERETPQRRHSGARAQRANPESRGDTASDPGFRARASGAPRNDKERKNKKRRRDRTGGPRPSRPRGKD
jgi:23S rRNA pseudouridine2605 synthase